MSHTFIAPLKDPSARLDHAMDWTDWLQNGETITAQTVTSASATITSVAQSSGIVTWRIAGGTLGQGVIVTVQVTTSTGRIDERSVFYEIVER